MCGCSPAVWQRAKPLVQDRIKGVQQACRSRLRSARQAAQTLHRQLRRKGEEKEAQQKALYQKLIQTAEQMVRQSRQVVAALSEQTEQQALRLLSQVRACAAAGGARHRPDAQAGS